MEVIDLEKARADKVRKEIEPLLKTFGEQGQKRPLVFMHNSEYWHFDRRNNCIRGLPKPKLSAKMVDELEKFWPMVIIGTFFEIGRKITIGTFPALGFSLIAITIAYKIVKRKIS